MLQFGGKDSKRHFTVVMGNKEHGLYVSSTPSSAAKKAVTKLCTANKSKKVEFSIREITQGSKKKTYGPYEGYIEKLKEPIELMGRVIRYKPVAKLSAKSSAKKGGMKGGGGGHSKLANKSPKVNSKGKGIYNVSSNNNNNIGNPAADHAPEPVSDHHPMIKKVGHIEGFKRDIFSLAFSPTGNTFAFTSDEGVQIYKFNKDGTPSYVTRIWTNRPVHVAYHPTLQLFAICEDDGATFYRIDNGSTFKEVAKWHVESGRPFSLSFHPTEPIAYPERKYGIGHRNIVTIIASHPTKEFFASGSEDYNAKIFKRISEKKWHCVKTIEHNDYVNALIFDSEGRLVTTSHDNTIRSFQLNDDDEWVCLQEFKTEDERGISSCAIHPEDPTIFVTGSVEGNLRVYKRSHDGTILEALETLKHTGEIYSVAFDPSKPNRLLVGLRPNPYEKGMNTLLNYEIRPQ
jgi:WD40 repeat protein